MLRLLLLCAIAITFSFCTGEKSNSETATANNATAAAPANKASANNATPVKQNFEASHEAPFCKLWVVQAALSVQNPQDYKGLWFDLKKDGTFESGKYQEQTNFGHWSIEKETNILKLLYNTTDIIPANWKIQGSGGGGRILWKGNVPGNPGGGQVMLEPDVKPSKE